MGLSFPPVYKRWGLNQGPVLLLNLAGCRTDNSCSSCVENWPKPSYGVRTHVLLWGVGPKHSGRSPVALQGWGWGCWPPVGATVPVWNVCLSKLVWPPVPPHLSPPPHKAKASGTPTHTHLVGSQRGSLGDRQVGLRVGQCGEGGKCGSTASVLPGILWRVWEGVWVPGRVRGSCFMSDLASLALSTHPEPHPVFLGVLNDSIPAEGGRSWVGLGRHRNSSPRGCACPHSSGKHRWKV